MFVSLRVGWELNFSLQSLEQWQNMLSRENPSFWIIPTWFPLIMVFNAIKCLIVMCFKSETDWWSDSCLLYYYVNRTDIRHVNCLQCTSIELLLHVVLMTLELELACQLIYVIPPLFFLRNSKKWTYNIEQNC